MYSDTEKLLGLVRRPKSKSEFCVRFKSQGSWELRYGARLLADVRLGLPSFPTPRLRQADFDATFARVFGGTGDAGMTRVWEIIDAALQQRHGTMVVVAVDAADQSARLATQATPITPSVIAHDALFRATAIDGAILLDPSGTCHGVGVILDGNATHLGSPARGARYNSAIRYVNDGEGRMAVVVSEDGHVDLFPRLRPPIEMREFNAILQEVADQAVGGEVDESLRKACKKLLRYYSDYVPEHLWDKVWKYGLTYPIGGDDDDDRSETFEKHGSDFTGDEAIGG